MTNFTTAKGEFRIGLAQPDVHERTERLETDLAKFLEDWFTKHPKAQGYVIHHQVLED